MPLLSRPGAPHAISRSGNGGECAMAALLSRHTLPWEPSLPVDVVWSHLFMVDYLDLVGGEEGCSATVL